jgi:hypothetical protein
MVAVVFPQENPWFASNRNLSLPRYPDKEYGVVLVELVIGLKKSNRKSTVVHRHPTHQ